MKKIFTFTKEERLNSVSEIEDLFKNGHSKNYHPLKMIYHYINTDKNVKVKVLLTVPSRKFRNATDRNRIKRKLREVYRLNRHRINTDPGSGKVLVIGIIYTGSDLFPDYKTIESAFLKFIEKINHLSSPQ